jgi:ethanolamine-phosphate phospho-lyase
MITSVETTFNITVTAIKNLDGDINYSNIKYALQDAAGKKYILKIFPDSDELVLAKEESRLLNEIGSRLSFSVPQTICNPKDNQLFFQHPKGAAKLLDYIDGDFIAQVPHTPELLFSLGEKIAELHTALQKTGSTVFASRKLFWDLQHAPMSYHKVKLVTEPERATLLTYFFDRFQQFVLPQLHALPHSIIHGDLNDYNILVKDGKIEGFLDFGDATFTATVNDLAIAITYMMLDKENPFEEILPLIKGYSKLRQLSVTEVGTLPDLITTRLCISLCNSAEKKYLGQDNAYVLVSEKPAWSLLEKWITISPVKIKNLFLAAAGFATDSAAAKKEQLIEIRQGTTGTSLRLSYASPVHMVSAAFQYMYDGEGNTYLDAYNNIAHVGHCHPQIAAAISRQIRLLNTNTRYLYEPFTTYTTALLQHFPSKLNKVFFVNSGSEAADLAIRMARTHTQKNTIAVVENGYHGNTSLGIDISAYKFDGKGGRGKSAAILKLPLPGLYKGKFNTAEEFAADALSMLQHSIETNNHPAAFITEIISGCGGQVPLAPGYLKVLKEYLDEHNILTITDEVQTGFGRLGKWFWGFEMHSIIPDIVILGKPMGNGHPLAAVVTTAAVADSFTNGMEFFSSFGGNPVSCVAGMEVLKIIADEKLQTNAQQVGDYFKTQLKQLQLQHSCVGDVRGGGLFLGIEFTDKEGRPDAATASFIKNGLKDNFILSGTDGPFDNVIKIKPPLCFSRYNADRFVDTMAGLLKNS